jgi:hypothetical protein
LLSACGGGKSETPPPESTGQPVRLTWSDIPDVLSPDAFTGIVSATREGNEVEVRTTWKPGEIVLRDFDGVEHDAAEAAQSVCAQTRGDLGDPDVNVKVYAANGSLLAYSSEGSCHSD